MMRIICAVILIIVGQLLSCGSHDFNGPTAKGGSTTTSTTTNLTPAVIATTAEGSQATSMVLQSKELLVTSTDIFKNLGYIAQSQMVSAVSGTGSGLCADYGTYDYDRTYANGAYNITYTFNICRVNDFQFDGDFRATGVPASFTGRVSTGLKILNFKNNYTTLIGSLEGTSIIYQMAGTGNATSGAYSLTTSGNMNAYDYYSLGRHLMTFTALSVSTTTTTDVPASVRTSTYAANGQYSVRTATQATLVTYESFTVTAVRQLATNIEDVDMQGRITVNRTPDAGIEGVFDVATPTDIRIDAGSYPPVTTQGTVVTNSSATAQYGAVDTILVSVGTDTPQSFAKEFMLMKQNDFYALEQQLPIVSGTTGSASGSIMSISALSIGSDIDCFTDVHVKYYTQANPLPADTKLWIVDWQSPNDCVSSSSVPYEQATNSAADPTGRCDVGLDINGMNEDITSGGVEHFLASSLPAGYYVLSIDNYSCTPGVVSNTASVLVGDYLFGPFACSYLASDGDGINPDAWCSLVDIRVNPGGAIDVLSHNPLIPLWH